MSSRHFVPMSANPDWAAAVVANKHRCVDGMDRRWSGGANGRYSGDTVFVDGISGLFAGVGETNNPYGYETNIKRFRYLPRYGGNKFVRVGWKTAVDSRNVRPYGRYLETKYGVMLQDNENSYQIAVCNNIVLAVRLINPWNIGIKNVSSGKETIITFPDGFYLAPNAHYWTDGVPCCFNFDIQTMDHSAFYDSYPHIAVPFNGDEMSLLVEKAEGFYLSWYNHTTSNAVITIKFEYCASNKEFSYTMSMSEPTVLTTTSTEKLYSSTEGARIIAIEYSKGKTLNCLYENINQNTLSDDSETTTWTLSGLITGVPSSYCLRGGTSGLPSGYRSAEADMYIVFLGDLRNGQYLSSYMYEPYTVSAANDPLPAAACLYHTVYCDNQPIRSVGADQVLNYHDYDFVGAYNAKFDVTYFNQVSGSPSSFIVDADGKITSLLNGVTLPSPLH